MICILMLICVSALGNEAGQLVVAPTKPAEERAPVKTTTVTLLHPWAQFCVAADEGREVIGASATEGVAATIVQQLCYVSFFNYRLCNIGLLPSNQVASGAPVNAMTS
jgi:hypothetical protein